METGKDGEYYYAELSKDEVIKLKEIVEKKARRELTSVNLLMRPSLPNENYTIFRIDAIKYPYISSYFYGKHWITVYIFS